MSRVNPWEDRRFLGKEYYGWIKSLPADTLRRAAIQMDLLGPFGSDIQSELEALQASGAATHNDRLLQHIKPYGEESFQKFIGVLSFLEHHLKVVKFTQLLTLPDLSGAESATHGRTDGGQWSVATRRTTEGTAGLAIGGTGNTINVYLQNPDTRRRGLLELASVKRQFESSHEEEYQTHGSPSTQGREDYSPSPQESRPTGASPKRKKRSAYSRERDDGASDKVEPADGSDTGIPEQSASPTSLSLTVTSPGLSVRGDTPPLSDGSESTSPTCSPPVHCDLSPPASESPKASVYRLTDPRKPETAELADVSVGHILQTSAGDIFLHPDYATEEEDIDDLLQQQGFNIENFKITSKAVRCSVTRNTLVSVLVRADSEGFYYPFIKDRLQAMLQVTFEEDEIRVKFDKRKHSVFLIVSMSAQSALRLYKYAIYTPGFLAGLGVQSVQVLGQLTALAVCPQDGQESQQPAPVTVEETDMQKGFYESLRADDLIPGDFPDHTCPQYHLLKECARKAFGDKGQMKKLVRDLEVLLAGDAGGCGAGSKVSSIQPIAMPSHQPTHELASTSEDQAADDDDADDATPTIVTLPQGFALQDELDTSTKQCCELRAEVAVLTTANQKLEEENQGLCKAVEEAERHGSEYDTLLKMALKSRQQEQWEVVRNVGSTAGGYTTSPPSSSGVSDGDSDSITSSAGHDYDSIEVSHSSASSQSSSDMQPSQPRDATRPPNPELKSLNYVLQLKVDDLEKQVTDLVERDVQWDERDVEWSRRDEESLRTVEESTTKVQEAEKKGKELKRQVVELDRKVVELERCLAEKESSTGLSQLRESARRKLEDAKVNYAEQHGELAKKNAKIESSLKTATQEKSRLVTELKGAKQHLQIMRDLLVASQRDNNECVQCLEATHSYKEEDDDTVTALKTRLLHRQDEITAALNGECNMEADEEKLGSLETSVLYLTSGKFHNRSASSRQASMMYLLLKHGLTGNDVIDPHDDLMHGLTHGPDTGPLDGWIGKWRTRCCLPEGTLHGDACICNGVLYVGILNASGSEEEWVLLQQPIDSLRDSGWDRIELPTPTNPDTSWKACMPFADESELFVALCPERTALRMSIYRYDDGEWTLVTTPPRIKSATNGRHQYQRIAKASGTIILVEANESKDHDLGRCASIYSFPVSGALPGMQEWAEIGTCSGVPPKNGLNIVVGDTGDVHVTGIQGDRIMTMTRTTDGVDAGSGYSTPGEQLPPLPAVSPGVVQFRDHLVCAGGIGASSKSLRQCNVLDRRHVPGHGWRQSWRNLPALCNDRRRPTLLAHGDTLVCVLGQRMHSGSARCVLEVETLVF